MKFHYVNEILLSQLQLRTGCTIAHYPEYPFLHYFLGINVKQCCHFVLNWNVIVLYWIVIWNFLLLQIMLMFCLILLLLILIIKIALSLIIVVILFWINYYCNVMHFLFELECHVMCLFLYFIASNTHGFIAFKMHCLTLFQKKTFFKS